MYVWFMGRYACLFWCDVYHVHADKQQYASILQCSAYLVYLGENNLLQHHKMGSFVLYNMHKALKHLYHTI